MAPVGIAAFSATSLLCGLAPTGDLAAGWLIGARALQGMAGAIMFPAAIGLVVEGFSREGRAKAMATFLCAVPPPAGSPRPAGRGKRPDDPT